MNDFVTNLGKSIQQTARRFTQMVEDVRQAEEEAYQKYREDIIRMAREAGLGTALCHNSIDGDRIWVEGADWHDEIERFFALAYEAGAAAERKRLRAEVDRLRALLRWGRDFVTNRVQTRRILELWIHEVERVCDEGDTGKSAILEVERLREDAERYRWLRDGGADKSNIGVYGWFKRIDGKQIRIWLARQELDDSIDAAKSEGQR